MVVHFVLYVRDPARSRDFWAAVLERAPRLDVPGMTEFALGGDAVLGLMPAAGITRLLGVVPPDGPARAELYLHVDAPVDAVARAVAAGGALLSPVARRDWGDDVGYVADPDGHVIGFARTAG